MTAQNTLKAALEKHNIYFDDWTAMTWVAILEAMEQHRRDGLEEVEKFVDECANRKGFINEASSSFVVEIQAKLAALKT